MGGIAGYNQQSDVYKASSGTFVPIHGGIKGNFTVLKEMFQIKKYTLKKVSVAGVLDFREH